MLSPDIPGLTNRDISGATPDTKKRDILGPKAVPYGRAVLRFYFFRNVKQSKNEDTVLVVEHILHFVFAV